MYKQKSLNMFLKYKIQVKRILEELRQFLKKKIFERKKPPTITDNKTFIDPANLFGGTRKTRIEQNFFLVSIVIICLKLP